MPTRIPTLADFESILPSHPSTSTSSSSSQSSSSSSTITLIYPSPPESTTSILILFHGLGDSEQPFASFARNMSLPGVLGIAVRGVAPLPEVLVPEGVPGGRGWHWGDDLRFEGGGYGQGGEGGNGGVDQDPGFERARRWVEGGLVGEVLLKKW